MKKKYAVEVVGEVTMPSGEELSSVSFKEIDKFLKEFAIKGISEQKVLSRLLDGFAVVEKTDVRVCNVVMNAQDFSLLRKQRAVDVESSATRLKKGLMGMVFGAYLWVGRDAVGVQCFGENSKELGKRFPWVKKAKKKLDIKD